MRLRCPVLLFRVAPWCASPCARLVYPAAACLAGTEAHLRWHRSPCTPAPTLVCAGTDALIRRLLVRDFVSVFVSANGQWRRRPQRGVKRVTTTQFLSPFAFVLTLPPPCTAVSSPRTRSAQSVLYDVLHVPVRTWEDGSAARCCTTTWAFNGPSAARPGVVPQSSWSGNRPPSCSPAVGRRADSPFRHSKNAVSRR